MKTTSSSCIMVKIYMDCVEAARDAILRFLVYLNHQPRLAIIHKIRLQLSRMLKVIIKTFKDIYLFIEAV